MVTDKNVGGEAHQQEKSILVVEDDAAWRGLWLREIGEIGAEPLLASTFEQAISLIEERRPSLAILDLNLPDKAKLGRIVLQRLDDYGLNMPVMIISAHIEPAEITLFQMNPRVILAIPKSEVVLTQIRKLIRANLYPEVGDGDDPPDESSPTSSRDRQLPARTAEYSSPETSLLPKIQTITIATGSSVVILFSTMGALVWLTRTVPPPDRGTVVIMGALLVITSTFLVLVSVFGPEAWLIRFFQDVLKRIPRP